VVALGLLSRRRFREMPPRVDSELTDCGRELVPIAPVLARRGMRHRRSALRDRKQVQADALGRQLPALLEEETDLLDEDFEAIPHD
jgi:DNA-binding HxlR family transcriptional regulator